MISRGGYVGGCLGVCRGEEGWVENWGSEIGYWGLGIKYLSWMAAWLDIYIGRLDRFGYSGLLTHGLGFMLSPICI